MIQTDIAPLNILARGRQSGAPLEAFGPVWNSLFFRLGLQSWHSTGMDTFSSNKVPYVATSSGKLSEDAVQVFLKSIEGREQTKAFHLLEIGSGSGVFAKLFLDYLCTEAPNIYRKTRFLVTDASNQLIDEQRHHEIFVDHEDHVMQVPLFVEGDWASSKDVRTFLGDSDGFDGIFANYVLDSLPIDVLAVRDDKTWRMEVRTILNASASQLPELDTKALIKTLDKNQDPSPFLPYARHFAMQMKHAEVDRATLPQSENIFNGDVGQTLCFLHCYGALDVIDSALTGLKSGGVMIFSDYGMQEAMQPGQTFEFQTYGNSVANGLNFYQVDCAFQDRKDVAYYKPNEEGGNIFTRVIQKGQQGGLSEIVDQMYGVVRHRDLNLPIETARKLLLAEDVDAVRRFYMIALEKQLRNWSLMEEIMVVLLGHSEYDAVIELADCALKINPIASGVCRNKAEALFALGRIADAHEMVDRGLALNPGDLKAHALKAKLYLRDGQFYPALVAVAKGLARDNEARERSVLVDVQNQILAEIDRETVQKTAAQTHRYRRLDVLSEL